MKNPYEYWAGRRGLQMWAVLDDDVVEVQFPFATTQSERLQGRPDYVGCVTHLNRNDGDFNVSVPCNGRELVGSCDTLEDAVRRARQLAVPLKIAV